MAGAVPTKSGVCAEFAPGTRLLQAFQNAVAAIIEYAKDDRRMGLYSHGEF